MTEKNNQDYKKMNKNTEQQHPQHQIILASGGGGGGNSSFVKSQHNPSDAHVQSSQYMMTAGRLNALKQRNNSTETNRQIFESGMRQRNSNQQNAQSNHQLHSFHANGGTQGQQTIQRMSNGFAGAGTQKKGQPYVREISSGGQYQKLEEKHRQIIVANQQQQINRNQLGSPGAVDLSDQAGEYQSILLTRYLKEPRLPPSSSYYNAQRQKKSQASRGGAGAPSKNHPQLTQKGFSIINQMTGGGNTENNQPSIQPQSPNKQNGAFMDSRKSRKRPYPTFSGGQHGKNEISYRNQNEIMRKIFGNEQNYHQVKSLLVRGPYQAEEQQVQSHKDSQQKEAAPKSPFNQKVINEYTQQPKAQQSPMNSQQKTISAHYDRRVQNKVADSGHQYGSGTPQVGPEEIILAKSHNKQEQLNTWDENQNQTSLQQPSGNNDQVEKAIFDLQDVKNNYFQEKTLYEQKIQQIQIKQNQTMSNGFGAFPNATAYNRTATSGFLPTAGSQRPLTQGGLILKNQQLMNDNNILKGDLELVSKEDLKERLVVAEMVMKKLFERNKNLEDQIVVNQKDTSFDLQDDPKSENRQGTNNKRHSHSIIGSPKNLVDIEPNDISAVGSQIECKNCVELRKEMTSKEKDMQERFNELQQSILKKNEGITKSSHIEYLQVRLEETLNEAKRHFSNYISARNNYNSFLESRLNLGAYQGGTKGQKIQADILSMLKKNLESSEQVISQEKDALKLSYAKTQALLLKKDQAIKKKDKQVKDLQEEIERRKFVENKVQRYVKGLISQNHRHQDFLDSLAKMSENQIKRAVEEFKQEIESTANVGAQDGGESTENEEEDEKSMEYNDQSIDRTISVEVNDL